MKNYAIVEDDVVVNVVVADEPLAETYVEYVEDNPAFVGGTYVDGYFYSYQPYPSWSRNAGKWRAPVPEPLTGKFMWNESIGEWVNVA